MHFIHANGHQRPQDAEFTLLKVLSTVKWTDKLYTQGDCISIKHYRHGDM